jgi:hypothetical protein
MRSGSSGFGHAGLTGRRISSVRYLGHITGACRTYYAVMATPSLCVSTCLNSGCFVIMVKI